MRRRLLPLICLLLLASPAAALEVPPARGYVADLADLLPTDLERRLESELAAFEASDSTQIAVLTVPTLEGEPLEAYALRVAEGWGIGRAGRDNGALLLVAVEEREVRIEVGYGLEGRLTDLLAGRIVDGQIVPRFRQGDYAGGILAGIGAMMEAVRGEYQGTGQPDRSRQRTPWGLLTLLFFLGPGLRLLGGGRRGRHRRTGGFWIGGGFGGRGGGGGFGGFGGGGFGGGGASGRW